MPEQEKQQSTHSQEIEDYFKKIEAVVSTSYDIARKCRAHHMDPDDDVEIPLTFNISGRVEGLISANVPQVLGSGIADRISELENEYGSLNWRVACQIALEVAQQKFCSFDSVRLAMETGIRIGLAYITLGVISAPLEGFIGLEIKKRKDGKEYVAASYAGPIRASGGTASAVSVLITDYVRKNMGYAAYDPTPEEIRRNAIELEDYNDRVTGLQYNPSAQEREFIVSHIPVEVTGDPTEELEVSNYKDLERIPTNRIRGGMCLVLAEGIALKAPKLFKQLSKWGKDFGLYWDWMDEFLKLQENIKAKTKSPKKEEETKGIKPNYTFVKDLVAGRPVYSYPLASGGFRIRYGRSRTSGFAAQAIHPATMAILNKSIATGTQLKIEMPGKANVLSPCDTIEGPVVRLTNGDVLYLDSENLAKSINSDIEEILYLGDILINYGDFSENGHILAPPGYCEEWWFLELEKKLSEYFAEETIEWSDAFYESVVKASGVEREVLVSLVKDAKTSAIDFKSCYRLSRAFNVPLHPRFTYHMKQINLEQFKLLINWIVLSQIELETGEKHQLDQSPSTQTILSEQDRKELATISNPSESLHIDLMQDSIRKIVLPYKKEEKKILEVMGIPHKVATQSIIIEKDFASSFYLTCAKFDSRVLSNLDELITACATDPQKANVDNKDLAHAIECKDVLSLVNSISDITFRDKSGTFIGGRMGRPEKAKMRRMGSSPHCLFPLGNSGGRMKSFQSAIINQTVEADFPLYYCPECRVYRPFRACETCGKQTIQHYNTAKGIVSDISEMSEETKESLQYYNRRSINFNEYFQQSLQKLHTSIYPDLIKGVEGTTNKHHIIEHPIKGILRAKHGVFVNKDGTIRYDMIEMPVTHFKPIEIDTPIERLLELGYKEDIYGAPLTDAYQIIELKPQDVLLPCCDEAPDERADDVFIRITKFIDDLLYYHYGVDPFYNVNTREDLIGHLVICMAPHTSAGIVGRIVGFTKTQGMYCHPMLHASMRRNCDGDEATALLLFDGLLNFSQQYLPDRRGSRTMDAPLVLTARLIPREIDDEVHGMDVVWGYPLEFYEIAQQCGYPWDIKIEQLEHRLGNPLQYEKFGFTHDTKNLNAGVLCSSYKTLPSMQDKLYSQMDLAHRIRAVHENDVAQLVLERHFIPDIKGNLRQFYKQTFRCTNCNEIYRRPPLKGKCLKCNKGNLVFTVSKGSIIKYLEPSLSIAEKYHLPGYLRQTLEILKLRIESALGQEQDHQEGLGKWF